MSNKQTTMTEGIPVPTVNNLHEPELECSLLPDYPGLLFYSDGRVFRIKTGRFLNGMTNTAGYKQLDFRPQGQGVPLIHRLIARAFVPNPQNLPVINHKNGVRDDNRAANLEWCTNMYNSQGLNKRRGFGCISESTCPTHYKNPIQAHYKTNGEKKVGKWFATREEAQAWLDAAEEVARANLRPDM